MGPAAQRSCIWFKGWSQVSKVLIRPLPAIIRENKPFMGTYWLPRLRITEWHSPWDAATWSAPPRIPAPSLTPCSAVTSNHKDKALMWTNTSHACSSDPKMTEVNELGPVFTPQPSLPHSFFILPSLPFSPAQGWSWILNASVARCCLAHSHYKWRWPGQGKQTCICCCDCFLPEFSVMQTQIEKEKSESPRNLDRKHQIQKRGWLR